MTNPLFQLGDFQFDLPNGVPQTLEYSADYRWEEQGRILRDPAQQFVGPGAQAITLDGVMFPGFSGRQSSMEELRTIAQKGEPQMLTDGLGKVYGKWAIKSVRESKSTFAPGGGAREITFTVQLVWYGDDKPGEEASPEQGEATDPVGEVDTDVVFDAEGSAIDNMDWSQTTEFSGLTEQATQSGFNLGQLATLASTGAKLYGQISRGEYVSAALGTFGMLGIPVEQGGAWAQIGVNAARLAESYVNGNGPTGMALAMQAASTIGGPALAASGIVAPGSLAPINSLLEKTATVAEILQVDPKVTDALRPLIVLTEN